MVENELAVLGAALLDPTTLDIASGIVSPQDFTDTALGKAFGLMVDIHSAGQAIDATTIVAKLRAAKLLDAIGGVTGVAGWAVACPSVRNVQAYSAAIQADAVRRRLASLGKELGERAADPKVDPSKVLDWLDGQLTRHRSGVTEGTQTLAGAMQEAIDGIRATKATGRVAGLPTGLQALDGAIGGLFPGELVIVAARPSIGKSAFGSGVALHNANFGREVLFVSLEMSGKDIATRQLAASLGVEVRVLRSAHVNDDDITDMERVQQEMRDVPFRIWSTRSATMTQIRAAARVQQATSGLSLLVLDYLGLVQATDRRKPRWESITEISGELKSLALELGIPVLCLCQLNRQAESGKPDLSHLRDAGAIEQDADVVMLLHRESRDSSKATIDVAKCRNGVTGAVDVGFDCSATRFVDSGVTDCYEPFA